jgi:MYXO-CTERM domain-containing protein
LPASDDLPLDQLVWSLDSFTGPNPIVDPPTLDPATGLFSWDISHAGFGGTYLAVIRATDTDGLSDTGILTILPAPEPSSGVLACVALVGLAAFARRRQ